MSNPNLDSLLPVETSGATDDSSFADILSNFEREHTERPGETLTGTIVSIGPETILLDIGRKTEGSLTVAKWKETQPDEPKVGAILAVTVGGRDEAGYYQLSTNKVDRPKDWSGLQAAFAEKRNIGGVVVEQLKGGFRVDIGVRAFMPASRSGVREADEMPKLVGQDIQCRITKLDTEKEDVVVDRRVVVEEEQAVRRQQAFAELKEGTILRARVRSLMDFGAFLEISPGVDGLLHVVDMSYARVAKASDVVKVGDELEVKVLKVDSASRKIALGLKQLQEDPWTVAARTFKVGDRVSGTVSRLADFGAFVELLPGVDGLIHLSELSWDKKIRKPGDLLKVGERVDAVILQVNPADRRIGLGYKQVLGDPWEEVPKKYPVGSTFEGPITNLTQFGAFVDMGDGIEGMIHISDITNEKRLDHPKDKVAKGQTVKALVLEIDKERRRVRLGMKQLEPTTVDHYIAEHKTGEKVSGRLMDVQGGRAKVELGEGVVGICQMKAKEEKPVAAAETTKSSDVGSLSAMLSARWKTGGASESAQDGVKTGQILSFKIANLDPAKRLIELELAQ
jgi:small subunit ribosomal protein S1